MSKPTQFVATLIAGRDVALDDALVTRVARETRISETCRDWLAPGGAVDLIFDEADALFGRRAEVRSASDRYNLDMVVQPVAYRRKQLLVADMDSTMIEQECIDELADLVGLRDHVAAITARAMAGELVFEEALKERVALLKGVRLSEIEKLLTSRVTLTAGARVLVQTMRAHGAYTALVSGGFTLFTGPVAARIGFHEHRANRLATEGDALIGEVILPILGREAKRAALVELRDAHGLLREETLAIGDGANDLDMLREAGQGVAFHAKPKVAEAADARIDRADLTALLYAQGYRREEFAS